MRYQSRWLIGSIILVACSAMSSCNSSENDVVSSLPGDSVGSSPMVEPIPSSDESTNTGSAQGNGELYSQSNNSALLFGPLIRGLDGANEVHRKKIGYSVSSSDPRLQLTSAYYLDGMETLLGFYEQIIGTIKNTSSVLVCGVQIDDVQFLDGNGQSLGENVESNFLLIAGSIGHITGTKRLSNYRCLPPGEEVHFYNSTYFYGQNIESISAVRFGRVFSADTDDYQLGGGSLLPISYTFDGDLYSVSIENTSNQAYSLSSIQSVFLDAGNEPVGVLRGNYSDFLGNTVVCPGAQRTVQGIPQQRFALDASSVRIVIGAYTLEDDRALLECT